MQRRKIALATIVMLAIGLYTVASIISLVRPVRKRHTDPHPDHDDDLHLTAGGHAEFGDAVAERIALAEPARPAVLAR